MDISATFRSTKIKDKTISHHQDSSKFDRQILETEVN
jgi:hypothetical protein